MNRDLIKNQQKAAEELAEIGQVNIWLTIGTFIFAGILASFNGWRIESVLFFTAAVLLIALQTCCNAIVKAINRTSVVRAVIQSKKP